MSELFERATGPDGKFAWIPRTLNRGRFVRDRVLGTGGQGYVLLAKDQLTGGSVVIKGMWWTPVALADPSAGLRAANDARRDLRSGADATQQVAAHVQEVPALITSFSVTSPTRHQEGAITGNDDIDFEDFYVYELVDSPRGGDLQNLNDVLGQRARSGSRFTEIELLEVAEQVAGTLSSLHKPRRLRDGTNERCFFIHGDLKPENILLWGDPVRYVVIDFDASIEVQERHPGEPGQRHWLTPAYAPPALYLRTEPIDDRFDVYALAATLYALGALEEPSENLRAGLCDPDPKGRGPFIDKVADLGYGPILTRVITDSMASYDYRLRSADRVRAELRRARAAHAQAEVLR